VPNKKRIHIRDIQEVTLVFVKRQISQIIKSAKKEIIKPSLYAWITRKKNHERIEYIGATLHQNIGNRFKQHGKLLLKLLAKLEKDHPRKAFCKICKKIKITYRNNGILKKVALKNLSSGQIKKILFKIEARLIHDYHPELNKRHKYPQKMKSFKTRRLKPLHIINYYFSCFFIIPTLSLIASYL